ncbi:MAG: hypothetical protein ACO1G9_09775 [Bacteroidota bacterium]
MSSQKFFLNCVFNIHGIKWKFSNEKGQLSGISNMRSSKGIAIDTGITYKAPMLVIRIGSKEKVHFEVPFS